MRTSSSARAAGRLALGAALLALTPSCSFYSTATRWNGRVGQDGKPVFVKTSTNIGLNLFIILPLWGSTTMDAMVETTTADIARENGDRVRVIETESENYWYGLAPFTWLFTPVITDVSMEYYPSAEELAKAQAAQRRADARQDERRQQDNSHVIPTEPRR